LNFLVVLLLYPLNTKDPDGPIHYLSDDFVAGISDSVVTIFLSTHSVKKTSAFNHGQENNFKFCDNDSLPSDQNQSFY
jgi:hypothetical protein